MDKPMVGILLDKKMKKQVMTNREMTRLRNFAVVQSEEVSVLSPAAVKKIIRNTEGIITGWGTPQLTKEMLDQAPDLRIIAHSAGSIRPIVNDEVWRRKIIVTTAAPSIGIGVAEFTLGLIITGLKRISQFNQITRLGGWGNAKEKVKIREFYDTTTIGIVGAGFVGRHLIELLKNFAVRILLYDPYVSGTKAAELGAKKVSLEKLMETSDAVSLHAPSIPATRHMLNRKNLKLMKSGSLLVNTARGSLIDEKALIKILKTGKIFACLDVTDPEPPDANSPFRKLENVLLTPHIAGAVTDNIYRQGHYAVTELERFFLGKKPFYRVTEEMLKKMA